MAARRDAVFCSKRCRQASHRFGKAARRRERAAQPMRFAYADPPYPGMARRYYADHPDFAGEVDHSRLVEQLEDGFPDGWALSTSAAALPAVLRLCPAGVRVACWVRGERPTVSFWPLNAWEPVIIRGGRPGDDGRAARRVDALVHHARPRTSDPFRVIGAKPAEFCWWLFDLLGALPGDDLVDLFPGSGGITRAWAVYESRTTSSETSPPGSPDTSPRGLRDTSRPCSTDASGPARADRCVAA